MKQKERTTKKQTKTKEENRTIYKQKGEREKAREREHKKPIGEDRIGKSKRIGEVREHKK